MNNTFIFILLISLNFYSYSQTLLNDTSRYSLEINVLDKKTHKEIKNSEIKILSNDSIIIRQKRNDTIPFHIQLDYNKHYGLSISTKDYNNITLKIFNNYTGSPKRFIESIYLNKSYVEYPDYSLLKFTLNSFELTQTHKNKLDSLIIDLNQIKSIKALGIRGGVSVSEKKGMGLKRAKAVKKYLIQNGLSSIKLVTKTYPKLPKQKTELENKKNGAYVSFAILKFKK